MQPIRLRAGSMVDRYEVVRCLGGGAGGAVYAARDQVLSRHVALKVLHANGGSAHAELAKARFLREGRIASRIRHPHVVDVFDFGVHDGVPFLVMELVDGESLAHLLARENLLPLTRAVDTLLPVLSAVAELHANGIVHGDIKPGNILLAREDPTWPRLADFGVSRFVEDSARSEEIVGTPAYMAPELFHFFAVAAERSDQYALGVLIYECTTGQRPFVGGTVSELRVAAARADLAGPSSHRASLPTAFDAIVMQALQRDPERRFASVDEFAEALLPFASDTGSARWRDEFVSPPASRSPVEPTVSSVRPTISRAADVTLSETLLDRGRLAPSSVTRLLASPKPGTEGLTWPPPIEPRPVGPAVLVVDDDELNLRTFRRAFRLDFAITCASSGAEALALLHDASFDVALVDFAMSGMSGVEFLRTARVLAPSLPAVMVTAHGDLPEVRAALASGLVQAIIMKPYDRDTILRWVLQCNRMASMRKTVGIMKSNVAEGSRL